MLTSGVLWSPFATDFTQEKWSQSRGARIADKADYLLLAARAKTDFGPSSKEIRFDVDDAPQDGGTGPYPPRE